MTPEQINRAIAQACGWRSMPFDHWLDPQGEVRGCFGAGDEQKFLPNYHGDLNAMHEAEKVLMADWNLMNAYQNHELPKFVKSTNSNWLCRATAAQRAEAFLKTLGLWEKSKP